MGCASSMPVSTRTNDLSSGAQHARDAPELESPELQPSPAECRRDLPPGLSMLKGRKMNILLIFSKQDRQCDSFRHAADKGGYNWRLVTKAETAVSCFKDELYDVVIIDSRHSKDLDGISLCRSLRAASPQSDSIFLAIVKHRCESDEPSIMPLLNVGFNKRFCENDNLGSCLNELISIEKGELRLLQQLRWCSAMYMALQNVSEGVEFIDQDFRTQFVNRAFERQSGYGSDEVLDRNMQEVLKTGHENEESSLIYHMKKGQYWEGANYMKRKAGGVVSTTCKIIPIESGRLRRYVMIRSLVDDLSMEHAKAELEKAFPGIYVRKRESIARLHAMMLDTPLSKSTDGFTPHIQQVEEEDDPLTNDLVGGLCDQTFPPNGIRQNSLPCSNKVASKSASRSSENSILSGASEELRLLLQSDASWEFNVIELERLTNRQPLVYLGLKILNRFGICQFLNIDERTLYHWLHLIQSNYHWKNPYHNATHSSDVLQAMAYYLDKLRSKDVLTAADEVAALIAAIVHDVDHPGRTSSFLVNAYDRLAILYNDNAVLESHHAAQAFMLTASEPKSDIFRNLERPDFELLRHSIIDMVLATDMARHFEHVHRFVVYANPVKSLKDDHGSPQTNGMVMPDDWVNTDEGKVCILRTAIKCADISNPSRPLKICIEWANRIAEEYFRQTEEERARNLPIVMPTFDRNTCRIAHSQAGFIEVLVLKMFESWTTFLDAPEINNNLQQNWKYWKEEDKKGSTSGSSGT